MTPSPTLLAHLTGGFDRHIEHNFEVGRLTARPGPEGRLSRPCLGLLNLAQNWGPIYLKLLGV